MRVLAAALAAFALTGTATAGDVADPSFSPPPGLYAYDPKTPLDVRQSSMRRTGSLTIRELSFASPLGGRATVSLVVPKRRHRVPAVILSPGGGQGRATALPFALRLARAGAAALVIDSPDVRTGRPLPSCDAGDRAVFVQYVVDLRRSLDLLSRRREIDRRRLAHVGFSYGTAVGAALAAVDHRVKAEAMMSARAGGSRLLGKTCSSGLSPPALAAYVSSMAVVDSENYVTHAAPTALLFENGTLDGISPKGDALALQNAASAPKTVRWYRADHTLNATALHDCIDWLSLRLRF